MKRFAIAFPFFVFALSLFGDNVYSSAYLSGWQIKNWENTTIGEGNGKTPGTRSLQIITSQKFGRLYIQAPTGFKTGHKQSLRLSVTSPVRLKESQLFVGLYKKDGSVIKNVPAGNYIQDKFFYEWVWYSISIPLSDLQATDQVIDSVVLELEEPGTVYVADISFSKADDSYLVPGIVVVP